MIGGKLAAEKMALADPRDRASRADHGQAVKGAPYSAVEI